MRGAFLHCYQKVIRAVQKEHEQNELTSAAVLLGSRGEPEDGRPFGKKWIGVSSSDHLFFVSL
jgi:hypothetical protein